MLVGFLTGNVNVTQGNCHIHYRKISPPDLDVKELAVVLFRTAASTIGVEVDVQTSRGRLMTLTRLPPELLQISPSYILSTGDCQHPHSSDTVNSVVYRYLYFSPPLSYSE